MRATFPVRVGQHTVCSRWICDRASQPRRTATVRDNVQPGCSPVAVAVPTRRTKSRLQGARSGPSTTAEPAPAHYDSHGASAVPVVIQLVATGARTGSQTLTGFRLVGSGDLLGDWHVDRAPQLSLATVAPDGGSSLWTATLHMVPGRYEYKVVRMGPAGSRVAEQGPDRFMQVPVCKGPMVMEVALSDARLPLHLPDDDPAAMRGLLHGTAAQLMAQEQRLQAVLQDLSDKASFADEDWDVLDDCTLEQGSTTATTNIATSATVAHVSVAGEGPEVDSTAVEDNEITTEDVAAKAAELQQQLAHLSKTAQGLYARVAGTHEETMESLRCQELRLYGKALELQEVLDLWNYRMSTIDVQAGSEPGLQLLPAPTTSTWASHVKRPCADLTNELAAPSPSKSCSSDDVAPVCTFSTETVEDYLKVLRVRKAELASRARQLATLVPEAEVEAAVDSATEAAAWYEDAVQHVDELRELLDQATRRADAWYTPTAIVQGLLDAEHQIAPAAVPTAGGTDTKIADGADIQGNAPEVDSADTSGPSWSVAPWSEQPPPGLPLLVAHGAHIQRKKAVAVEAATAAAIKALQWMQPLSSDEQPRHEALPSQRQGWGAADAGASHQQQEEGASQHVAAAQAENALLLEATAALVHDGAVTDGSYHKTASEHKPSATDCTDHATSAASPGAVHSSNAVFLPSIEPASLLERKATAQAQGGVAQQNLLPTSPPMHGKFRGAAADAAMAKSEQDSVAVAEAAQYGAMAGQAEGSHSTVQQAAADSGVLVPGLGDALDMVDGLTGDGLPSLGHPDWQRPSTSAMNELGEGPTSDGGSTKASATRVKHDIWPGVRTSATARWPFGSPPQPPRRAAGREASQGPYPGGSSAAVLRSPGAAISGSRMTSLRGGKQNAAAAATVALAALPSTAQSTSTCAQVVEQPDPSTQSRTGTLAARNAAAEAARLAMARILGHPAFSPASMPIAPAGGSQQGPHQPVGKGDPPDGPIGTAEQGTSVVIATPMDTDVQEDIESTDSIAAEDAALKLGSQHADIEQQQAAGIDMQDMVATVLPAVMGEVAPVHKNSKPTEAPCTAMDAQLPGLAACDVDDSQRQVLRNGTRLGGPPLQSDSLPTLSARHFSMQGSAMASPQLVEGSLAESMWDTVDVTDGHGLQRLLIPSSNAGVHPDEQLWDALDVMDGAGVQQVADARLEAKHDTAQPDAAGWVVEAMGHKQLHGLDLVNHLLDQVIQAAAQQGPQSATLSDIAAGADSQQWLAPSAGQHTQTYMDQEARQQAEAEAALQALIDSVDQVSAQVIETHPAEQMERAELDTIQADTAAAQLASSVTYVGMVDASDGDLAVRPAEAAMFQQLVVEGAQKLDGVPLQLQEVGSRSTFEVSPSITSSELLAQVEARGRQEGSLGEVITGLSPSRAQGIALGQQIAQLPSHRSASGSITAPLAAAASDCLLWDALDVSTAQGIASISKDAAVDTAMAVPDVAANLLAQGLYRNRAAAGGVQMGGESVACVKRMPVVSKSAALQHVVAGKLKDAESTAEDAADKAETSVAAAAVDKLIMDPASHDVQSEQQTSAPLQEVLQALHAAFPEAAKQPAHQEDASARTRADTNLLHDSEVPLDSSLLEHMQEVMAALELLEHDDEEICSNTANDPSSGMADAADKHASLPQPGNAAAEQDACSAKPHSSDTDIEHQAAAQREVEQQQAAATALAAAISAALTSAALPSTSTVAEQQLAAYGEGATWAAEGSPLGAAVQQPVNASLRTAHSILIAADMAVVASMKYQEHMPALFSTMSWLSWHGAAGVLVVTVLWTALNAARTLALRHNLIWIPSPAVLAVSLLVGCVGLARACAASWSQLLMTSTA